MKDESRKYKGARRPGAGSLPTPGRVFGIDAMSTTQILAELPRLSHADRRKIARRLIELGEKAPWLADCDARADANFQMLDAMEAEDGARQNWSGFLLS